MRSFLQRWSGWMAAGCISISFFVSACSGADAFTIIDDDAGEITDSAAKKDVGTPHPRDAAPAFDGTTDDAGFGADGGFGDGGFFDSGPGFDSGFGFDGGHGFDGGFGFDGGHGFDGGFGFDASSFDSGSGNGTCPSSLTYTLEYINAPVTATPCGGPIDTCAVTECCSTDKCVPL